MQGVADKFDHKEAHNKKRHLQHTSSSQVRRTKYENREEKCNYSQNPS